jgi:hypothetical protein
MQYRDKKNEKRRIVRNENMIVIICTIRRDTAVFISYEILIKIEHMEKIICKQNIVLLSYKNKSIDIHDHSMTSFYK